LVVSEARLENDRVRDYIAARGAVLSITFQDYVEG
jgi:hypothetical protein